MLDDKINELEEILKSLEKEGVSVEDGITLFERGISVTKDCLNDLSKMKGKITELKKQMNELIETPFDVD